MSTINEISNTSIIISSLEKIYNNLRLKGVSNSKDLYMLDAIYKILYGCDISLTSTQRKELTLLYNKVASLSDMICPTSILPEAYTNHKSKFTTDDESLCCNTPNQNNMYYWQETIVGKPALTIIQESLVAGFVDDKNVSTIESFALGKSITYENVGKICFLISGAEVTDNYKVYDINNLDVTAGFTTSYLNEIKSRIIISINEYTPSTLTLKIKI